MNRGSNRNRRGSVPVPVWFMLYGTGSEPEPSRDTQEPTGSEPEPLVLEPYPTLIVIPSFTKGNKIFTCSRGNATMQFDVQITMSPYATERSNKVDVKDRDAAPVVKRIFT